MKSMTGFGRDLEEKDGNKIAVEVTGTNRKHPDIRFGLSKELAGLEARLRPQVQQWVNRGCVNVQIDHELSEEYRHEQLEVDSALAEKLVGELKQLAEKTGIGSDVTLSDLLAIPGVVREKPEHVPMDELTSLASAALARALEQFDRQKQEEGTRLAEDIRSRCEFISEKVETIADSQQELVEQYCRKLRKRVKEIADEDVADDEERLTREAVYYAERSDISEELTRLQSHLREMYNVFQLEEGGDCGRKMDFMCQEMHRELNTIGSKTADAEGASLALQAKAEVARLREQVQNIE